MSKRRAVGLAALMMVAVLSAACTAQDGSAGGTGARGEQGQAPAPADRVSSSGSSDDVPVLMLGRSVMEGWFQHWGGGDGSPVSREGFVLTYGTLESPPGIAESAESLIDEHPESRVVFFKFCFEDFSSDDGASHVAQMERWVEEVADHARASGKQLVVGNALPRVRAQTDAPLRAQHREFGRWLEGFSAERDDVRLFDLNGPLADSAGALRSQYALGPDDSHLNDEAYSVLDASLFTALGQAAGR